VQAFYQIEGGYRAKKGSAAREIVDDTVDATVAHESSHFIFIPPVLREKFQ
jgi:hypothetical protein